MELMSFLLLCALAVALPQALGEASSSRQSEILILLKPNTTAHKQILLNMNAPPLVNSATKIQSVFKDASCKKCLNCMERAIKAHLKQSHYDGTHEKLKFDDIYYELSNENHPMTKRDVNITKPYVKSKAKPRGIKSNKVISVTKYFDENGKVDALKVKELSSKNETDGKKYKCKVYSVTQTMSCDSFGIDVTKEAPKKKVKRDKKSKNRTSTSKHVVPTTTTPSFKKRDIYNSEVPESYMPSLEDMY